MDGDPKRRFARSQFAVVLVLAPLNGTFERKCLVVPFTPDVLKLGRQTTSRTAASADNGFFDSRVLSRQHAEVWADRDSGKVWLRDAKSSNGTYINKKRLSPENTESEPFEVKKGDQLDLGIDIVSNDDTKQMYKKISAKVEKVSILPLHAGLKRQSSNGSINGVNGSNGLGSDTIKRGVSNALNGGVNGAMNAVGNGTVNGTAVNGTNGSNGTVANGGAGKLVRSPSLETLRTVKSPPLNTNSEAIFGGCIEALALNHASTTAGGLLIKDSVKTHVGFELAAKRLVAEIRAVRADTAKIQSVATLLNDIKRAALDAEEVDRKEREQLERELKELTSKKLDNRTAVKSSSIAALKAENARLRAENAHTRPKGRSRALSTSIQAADLGTGNSGSGSSPTLPELADSADSASPASQIEIRKPQKGSSQDSKTVHNILVLLFTAVLVTISGLWIMVFFTPPLAPQSQNPLLFWSSGLLQS